MRSSITRCIAPKCRTRKLCGFSPKARFSLKARPGLRSHGRNKARFSSAPTLWAGWLTFGCVNEWSANWGIASNWAVITKRCLITVQSRSNTCPNWCARGSVSQGEKTVEVGGLEGLEPARQAIWVQFPYRAWTGKRNNINSFQLTRAEKYGLLSRI